MFVFGVAFKPKAGKTLRYNMMEVVLVQSRSETAPPDADRLAQANHIGGGDAEENVRPTTPFRAVLPADFGPLPPAPTAATTVTTRAAAAPMPPPAPSPPAAAPTSAPELVAEVSTPQPAPLPKPRMKPDKKIEKTTQVKVAKEIAEQKKPAMEQAIVQAPPSAPAPTAATLVARSFAIASLDAEIEERENAIAKRPRRKFISASTREYKYAAYMEAWRAKVERVGNLNYPDEARREKLSGSLILDVALNADGSINEITVRRPSGHALLDDAAIRIVKMAAPYAAFPEDFVKEVDILHITRTWQFQNSEHFAASQ
jgi:protein TonB